MVQRTNAPQSLNLKKNNKNSAIQISWGSCGSDFQNDIVKPPRAQPDTTNTALDLVVSYSEGNGSKNDKADLCY